MHRTVDLGIVRYPFVNAVKAVSDRSVSLRPPHPRTSLPTFDMPCNLSSLHLSFRPSRPPIHRQSAHGSVHRLLLRQPDSRTASQSPCLSGPILTQSTQSDIAMHVVALVFCSPCLSRIGGPRSSGCGWLQLQLGRAIDGLFVKKGSPHRAPSIRTQTVQLIQYTSSIACLYIDRVHVWHHAHLAIM